MKAVQELTVQDRRTDKDAKTEEVRAKVTVTGNGLVGAFTAQGIVVFRYKHFEQGWKLQSADAEGRFSVY